MNLFKNMIILLTLLFFSCDTGNLKIIADLPSALKEVSGIETVNNSKLLWMINDAGNSSKLYGLNEKGKIIKELKINAENNDWEDLTSDDEGNIYIGDFGNNKNKRENLTILKIKNQDLSNKKSIDVERISFHFDDQFKFPPKKNKRYFDCEAFFYFNDSLYLFTKSRVSKYYGKTSLYKVPAKPGNYTAKKIDSYVSSCKSITCWITSADISPDKSKIILLTPDSFLLFSNFKDDNFLSGNVTELDFDFISQKESVSFKDDYSLYVSDEKTYGIGGNLYKFKLDYK